MNGVLSEMAKILISSLGTGRLLNNNSQSRDYEPAVYRFLDSGKEYKTPFIAAALSEHLQIDKLYLIGTTKSMWEEVYNYFLSVSEQEIDNNYWEWLVDKITSYRPGESSNMDDNDLKGINEAIDSFLKYKRYTATGGSRCFIIDYGLNEKELWNNFDVFMQIGEYIEEDDEVYIDITHAFRSIPLFLYLMLDLIGTLKFKNRFKLIGLFYGMFDAKNDFNYVPVIDLSELYNITLWSKGAYDFINYGNGYVLSELIKDEDISKSIENISNLININYIKDFKNETDRLSDLLDNTRVNDPVLRYMEPYLRTFINRFKGISSSSMLQFELARWYFENNRFAQGYICLAESIISKILETYRVQDSKINWNNNNREKVKSLIYREDFKQHSCYYNIYETYDNVRITRNMIAHAGFSNKKDYKNDIEEFSNYLKNVKNNLFDNRALDKIPDKFPFCQI